MPRSAELDSLFARKQEAFERKQAAFQKYIDAKIVQTKLTTECNQHGIKE